MNECTFTQYKFRWRDRETEGVVMGPFCVFTGKVFKRLRLSTFLSKQYESTTTHILMVGTRDHTLTYKALDDLASDFILFFFWSYLLPLSPHRLIFSSYYDLLALLNQTSHPPTSGPLYLPCLLYGVFFPTCSFSSWSHLNRLHRKTCRDHPT